MFHLFPKLSDVPNPSLFIQHWHVKKKCRNSALLNPIVIHHPSSIMIVINIAMENGPFIDGLPGFTYYYTIYHWIGLRENLNRKPWFLPSN